jgi:hypothetical protein
VAPVSKGKWIGVVAVAAVIGFAGGCALVLALKTGNESDNGAEEEGRAFAPVEGAEAAKLAERFRPWLMFDSYE